MYLAAVLIICAIAAFLFALGLCKAAAAGDAPKHTTAGSRNNRPVSAAARRKETR